MSTKRIEKKVMYTLKNSPEKTENFSLGLEGSYCQRRVNKRLYDEYPYADNSGHKYNPIKV